MGERCYVYAIASPDLRLPEDVSGFGGPLYILPSGELGAVVSRTDVASEDNVGLPATPDNLLRHESVVETVCSAGPALPVRFGTVLASEEAVTRALAVRYDTLLADLHQLGDKVEIGITVLWRSPAVQTSTPGGSAQAGGQTDDAAVPADRRRGLAYLRNRQAEYRRGEAARERALALARDLDAALRPYALDCQRSLCPSERLALRDVYLMQREQVSAFEQAFDEVRQHRPEVRFLLSGPWPPYSFLTPPADDERHDARGANGAYDTQALARERSRANGWTGAAQ